MSEIDPDAVPSFTTPETLVLPRDRAPARPAAVWEHRSAAWQNVNVSGYQVLGELGRGGMGIVYEARQLSLNRLVALKMLLPDGRRGDNDLARLRAEAEAIAGLRHPNIIQIYEIGEQDGLPFLALEYCDGGSLDRKLNGTPIPAEQAAKLIETLARAIHAAHQVGVVHRDLKPSNILLTAPDGQPKITDFGLAKRVGSQVNTRTGHMLGTPSYMAPEQADSRNKKISPATDIYALGGILYELLTGRPPFRAASQMETIAQVLHQQPAPPRLLNPRIETDLQTICLKCLEKDPARRYASALELANDLQCYLAREPISARSVNLLDRLSRTLGHSHLGSEFFVWSIILFYFAEVTLFSQIGLFTLISARFPLFWIVLMLVVQFLMMSLPFRYYSSRRLFSRSIDERQLWSIWIGYLLACSSVAVVSHVLFGVDKLYEFYLYPYWTILSGLAFFVMGTRYWGRCYLFGVAFFVLAGLMPFFLPWSALVFGLLWCSCLVSIGRHLRRLALEAEPDSSVLARSGG